MYTEKFLKALSAANLNVESGIGTYKERTQHKVLKFFFEAEPEFHEVPLRSYIADICRDGHIFEIQSSGFENLTSKLEDFLFDHKVSVVYPAPIVKTVIWTDEATGESIEGRRVKKESDKFKLLPELLYVSKFVNNDNFEIIVVMTEICDLRKLDGRGKDKKIKATKVDKIPKGVISIERLSSVQDIKEFAQLEDGVLYSRADLQKKFKLIRRNLYCAIKALVNLGIIEEHSKQKNKIYYSTCK